MYADYLQDAGDKRRNFLRRLDHEIKNPLTGLRAASRASVHPCTRRLSAVWNPVSTLTASGPPGASVQ